MSAVKISYLVFFQIVAANDLIDEIDGVHSVVVEDECELAVEPVMKVKPVQVQPTTMQPVQFGSVEVEPVKAEPVKIEFVEVEPVQVEPLQLEPLQFEIQSRNSTSNVAIVEGALQLKSALKISYDTGNSCNFIFKGIAACLILGHISFFR